MNTLLGNNNAATRLKTINNEFFFSLTRKGDELVTFTRGLENIILGINLIGQSK